LSEQQQQNDVPRDYDDATWWFYFATAIILVLFAGLMSGLTLGLMSLDVIDLEVLRRSGSQKEKKQAKCIAPLLKNPHRVLVTLLLFNAAAAESLPLLIDRLANPVAAIIISVSVLLVFGEILPQAACASYGLAIGATFTPLVWILMYLGSPIVFPISYVLDYIIGNKESALFRRGQFKALVDIHAQGAHDFGGNLSADEARIMKGALDLTSKTAAQAMTPLDLVFMLPSDAELGEDTLTAILASGHSRIPIHAPGQRRHILGILLVKELLLVDPRAKVKVSDLKIRSLPHLPAGTPMWDLLKLFEIGRSHMAVLTRMTPEFRQQRESARAAQEAVERAFTIDIDSDLEEDEVYIAYDEYADVLPAPSLRLDDSSYNGRDLVSIGIITIEDVLEELMQQEIVDETDRFVDNLHLDRVDAAVLTRSLPPHLQEILKSRSLLPRIGPTSSFMDTRPAFADMHSMDRERTTGVDQHHLPPLTENGDIVPPPPPPSRGLAALQQSMSPLQPLPRTNTTSLSRHLASGTGSASGGGGGGGSGLSSRRDSNMRQDLEDLRAQFDSSLRPLMRERADGTKPSSSSDPAD
jgi:metal transporter CNNM